MTKIRGPLNFKYILPLQLFVVMGQKFKFGILAILLILIVVIAGCITQKSRVIGHEINTTQPAKQPTSSLVFIESISPSSGYIGTEVVIHGSGFTPTRNDIGFILGERDIAYRGSITSVDETGMTSTDYNGITSLDGKTLRFTFPGELGRCTVSQRNPPQTCTLELILLSNRSVQLFVENKNSVSNSVTFNLIKSELDNASDLIMSDPKYSEIEQILHEISSIKTPDNPYGLMSYMLVSPCNGTFCLVVEVEKDVPELTQKIPTEIAGFKVKVRKLNSDI